MNSVLFPALFVSEREMQQEPDKSSGPSITNISSCIAKETSTRAVVGLNWLIKVSAGLPQTADGLSDHCVLTGSVDVTEGTDQTLRFAVREENCFYDDEMKTLRVRQDIYCCYYWSTCTI